MDRAFAVVTVAAFLLLAASAERPMGRQTPASGAATSKLALPPAGHHQRLAAADEEDAAAMAGERLPFVAAHHLPAASWAHRPLPWAGSEAEAGELGVRGKAKELVPQRHRPSYVGDGTTTTSQEQLCLKKASSLPGASDVAKAEPAKTADTAEEEELPELLNPDEPWLRNHCVINRHDFSTGSHHYNQMLHQVDVCLFTWSERRSSDHWVLCPEPNDPNDAPCGYVIVPLREEHGYEFALAFRADNLDLVAFANRTNNWHVFKRYAHLIPSATVLDFHNHYKDLLGTGDEAKMSVPLSGTSFLQASRVISLYMKAPGIEEIYIKVALGTMAIGIPEAKRFTPVREVIVSGWLQGTTLNEMMAKYLSNWRELSCALMAAEKSGAWGTDEDSKTLVDLDIAKSKQDASDIVDVLLDCPYQ